MNKSVVPEDTTGYIAYLEGEVRRLKRQAGVEINAECIDKLEQVSKEVKAFWQNQTGARESLVRLHNILDGDKL